MGQTAHQSTHCEHKMDHGTAGEGTRASQGLNLLLQGDDVAIDGILDVRQLTSDGTNQLCAQLG